MYINDETPEPFEYLQESLLHKNSIKHATMRVLLFQTIAPGIPLPPHPVLTRWETWLDAVNYYAEHYGKILEVIDALDSTDSSPVAAVKSLPSEQLLEDILFIDSDFKIVSKSITLLESSKLQLSEALNIVVKVSQTVIQNKNSLISEKVKCKLRNIIAKNSAYSQLRIINYVLSGHDKTSEVGVLKNVTFRSSNMHLLHRVMSNSSSSSAFITMCLNRHVCTRRFKRFRSVMMRCVLRSVHPLAMFTGYDKITHKSQRYLYATVTVVPDTSKYRLN
ncbi:hypothetical protein ANN_11098 [Periplaneta americana]|uniref:Uncharacterized protein n=1 Tax=Periplaneta americana TaxID=6978 RepID=A0ABQ8T5T0_PERAM|nr:hypothetical protein ANN_11098 [Periplaneta americana]